VCDLETSRMGAPYIYDISRLRVKDLHSATYIYVVRRLRVNMILTYGYLNTGLGLGLGKHEAKTAMKVSKNTETRARI